MNKQSHKLFNAIDPSRIKEIVENLDIGPIHYCPICKKMLLMGVKICSECLEVAKSKDK